MNQRQAKEFYKWGVIFPKGVPKPKVSKENDHYYICPECGEYIPISGVGGGPDTFIDHWQNNHTIKEVNA